ncbi:MAG: VOC family protein [Hamadaea sp.]|nr:VOC family protein [Hamadaea sp.]
MDHVSVVVEDLDAAVAFFTELGMESEGAMPVEGRWVEKVNGLDGMRLDIVMMRTPDGHGKLELTKFHSPTVITGTPDPAPPNTLGFRTVMFAVDDIGDTVARLREHGGELIGEITRYEDFYLLCYLRGPSGVIVALAEELG